MSTLTVRLPGWAWLPQVLRSGAYWREVGRFALWGPLIGGAPYAVFIFTLPFVYVLGLGPAVVAGLLFAAWIVQQGQRLPAWPWRLAVGVVSALLAAGLGMLVMGLNVGRDGPFWFLLFALHGVPAAAVLAISYSPVAPRGFRMNKASRK